MSGEFLFECDFSIDELAVLADLFEIPALPGGDPDVKLPEEAKAAAARGLLARRVVVANGATGSVEITQPYATMIGIVLFATEATALEDGTVIYQADDAEVSVRPASASGLASWRTSAAGATPDPARQVLRATAGAGGLTITAPPSPR